MSNPFRTLDDADVSGKRVLLRVDLNVPTDKGKVTDTTRIDEPSSLPLSSGSTSPTAFAAPVVVGIIDKAAPRAR